MVRQIEVIWDGELHYVLRSFSIADELEGNFEAVAIDELGVVEEHAAAWGQARFLKVSVCANECDGIGWFAGLLGQRGRNGTPWAAQGQEADRCGQREAEHRQGHGQGGALVAETGEGGREGSHEELCGAQER